MTIGQSGETSETISPNDRLYRRLPRDVVKDGRVHRGAYYFRGEPDPSLSVDLASLTTPEETRARAKRPERFGVGELDVSVPLDLGFSVRRAPVDGNPSHCLIEGPNSKDLCDRLAEKTRIVIPPPIDP